MHFFFLNVPEPMASWRLRIRKYCLLEFFILLTGFGSATEVPHGIVEIANADPRNPIKRVTEGDYVVVDVVRRGGCKYPAKVTYKCLDRTAHLGRDFMCPFQELNWDDDVEIV